MESAIADSRVSFIQFSGLPIFSAGAYELGRDQGPVVAEGVVSPFSVRPPFFLLLSVSRIDQ